MLLTNDDTYIQRAASLADIMRIIERPPLENRFAATSFGIKTCIAPLSAAVARVQFRHMPKRNERRNENQRYLSAAHEELGLNPFLPPSHVERVYFEYLIRCDDGRWNLPIEKLVEALWAEGCDAQWPRYPLVHQQPIFTEGHFARIAGLESRTDLTLPVYAEDALPKTEAAISRFLKLPAFPSARVTCWTNTSTHLQKCCRTPKKSAPLASTRADCKTPASRSSYKFGPIRATKPIFGIMPPIRRRDSCISEVPHGIPKSGPRHARM